MIYCAPFQEHVFQVIKMSDLESRTYSQLLRIAGRSGISGRHRMKKKELISALEKHRKRRTAPGSRAATPDQKPDLKELPDKYGKTRLILMEIDPYQVHAFWEVTVVDGQKADARLGRKDPAVAWVLRFYETAGCDAAESTMQTGFDVPVDLAPGNWYVRLPASDRNYCAELGPISKGGRFSAACRSNIIHIPRRAESAHYEPRWAKAGSEPGALESVPEPLYFETGSLGASTEVVFEIPGTGGICAEGDFEVRVNSMENPELETPAGTFGPGISSVLLASTGPGASLKLSMEKGGDASGIDLIGNSGRSGHSFKTKSSARMSRKTEVIIRGKTLPGQTLCVNGHWVPVNPDGTFYSRQLLPIRSD